MAGRGPLRRDVSQPERVPRCRARRIAPSERAAEKANDIALFLTFHQKHPSHGYRWLNAKIRLGLGLVMSDEYARRCCRCAGIVSESRHYRYKKPGEPGKSFPNMILASLDITCMLKK